MTNISNIMASTMETKEEEVEVTRTLADHHREQLEVTSTNPKVEESMNSTEVISALINRDPTTTITST
jgi:hypothetical protein